MAVTQEKPKTQALILDKVHSSAAFEVRHSQVALFRGGFSDVDATLDLTGEEPQITGTVEVASVDISEEGLKGHLLSPDFFDAERNPQLRFVSDSVKRGDDGSLEVAGQLTLKGYTQPVIAYGRIGHVEADISGGERYGVELSTTIDRTSYGIDWNAELPSGGAVLDNDVKITVALEFVPEQ